jgi:predicted lipoprotein with Yx(FWY)xxD motif
MNRTRLTVPILAVLIAAFVAVVVATSGGSAKTRPAVASRSAISLRQTAPGKTLVDANGRALYLFEADKPNVSTLSGAGLAIWPPFTSSAKPRATNGVIAARIGTITGAGGSRQVTMRVWNWQSFLLRIAVAVRRIASQTNAPTINGNRRGSSRSTSTPPISARHASWFVYPFLYHGVSDPSVDRRRSSSPCRQPGREVEVLAVMPPALSTRSVARRTQPRLGRGARLDPRRTAIPPSCGASSQ